MRESDLTIPEIALIAATRGMLGAGIGLLVAPRIPPGPRQAVGWTLFAIGALSTIPLAIHVLGKSRPSRQEQTEEDLARSF